MYCWKADWPSLAARPLLTNDLWRPMLSESISRATANHEFDLIAFVFMPGLLKAIKRPYFYRIKQLLKHPTVSCF